VITITWERGEVEDRGSSGFIEAAQVVRREVADAAEPKDPLRAFTQRDGPEAQLTDWPSEREWHPVTSGTIVEEN
jgi:hypothetical protein